MGNTLSEARKGQHPEIYKGERQGEHLLRKKIHEILMNQKQTINGREIYVNRRKTFCRVGKNDQGTQKKIIIQII